MLESETNIDIGTSIGGRSDIIKIQQKDNVKARKIDRYDKNTYLKDRIILLNQSQVDTHKYLKLKQSNKYALI
jgi:hypothetical protein